MALFFLLLVSPCLNCFSHPGKIEKIAGVECYVATPEGEYQKDHVILYLSDVLGIPLINAKVCDNHRAARTRLTIFGTLDSVRVLAGQGSLGGPSQLRHCDQRRSGRQGALVRLHSVQVKARIGRSRPGTYHLPVLA